ncbi:uncharacterized protein LOC103983603 [Musa acuminata AAA Group]|uniref:uncharacterized protein LOC103983603 n=1 Tax=Musa acuminata AAA Group TaxID=214697 RepID=UPI0031DD1E3C
MPSPHHLRHHHNHSPTDQRCCCCSCCCYSTCCSPHNPSPPPSLTTSDHLLQALATQLLLQSESQSRPLLDSHQPLLKPHQAPPPLHPLFQDHQHGRAYHQHHPPPQQLYQHQAYPLIHSLLRRVSALESSFPHLASSASPPPSPLTNHQQRRPVTPPPPPPPPTYSYSSSAPSLRDLAARKIQASFRRLLLRRSQTLRHLKDLAAMKSHVAALRSALSDKAHADPRALSERAMDLLLRLDAVQSSGPIVREGKRSISRELARILEFIDKVLVKEHQLSLDAIEIAGNGGQERSFVEDGRTESEGAEEVMRVAKKVSFLEDGKRSRVSFSGCNQFVEELSNAGYQNGQVKSLGGKAARNGARDRMGSERFYEISEDEKSSEGSVENSSRVEKFLSRNGRLGLSAPLPVQMEPRRM